MVRHRRLAAMTAHANALEDDRRRFQSVLDTAHDAYVGMDAAGLVDEWNDAARRIFGWSRVEAVGRPLAELIIPPDLREAHTRGLATYQQTGHGPVLGGSHELTAVRRDGARISAEVTIWESWSGGTRRFNAFLRDVTERKRAAAELARGALRDSLTGLANRALFGDRVAHALARRSGERVAVLLLDIDGFDAVNAGHGRTAGDHLLVSVANRLAASVRASDTLARIAGDEFALLAEDVVGAAEARQLADRLIDAIAPPFQVAGRDVVLGVSIGIAVRATSDADPDSLLQDADIAMHTAKAAPGSSHATFESEMHGAAGRRLEQQADLARALERDELRVHYQPYVDLPSGLVTGFEALVRWQHPTRGLLAPADFVPSAEQSGLIRAVDRWVLAEAARQAAWWQASRAQDLPLTMSVNLSTRALQDDDLVAEVAAVLASTGLAARTLVLEIGADALRDQPAAVAARLSELRRIGVQVAVDGFGSDGVSGREPTWPAVDAVKVDLLVAAVAVEDVESDVARALAGLRAATNPRVVAKNVETASQLAGLGPLGCDAVQGLVFAQPLPAADAAELLARRLDSRATGAGEPDGHLALPV